MNPNLKVHLIPSKIEYEGEADVQNYFKISEQGDQLNSEFRGRLLKGKILDLKGSNLKGCILNKTSNEDKFIIEQQFDELNIWGHDIEPNQEDPYLKFTEWYQLANVLHTEDEI